MTKTRPALIAGTILSLGLLTACGGDGDPEDTDATGRATPKASASAAKQTGPAYKGPELPGLSAEPAWSLRSGDLQGCADDPAKSAATEVVNFDAQTCVLGDAVVLTQDLSEQSQAEEVEHRFRARLHDPATGKVRRTIDVTIPADWQGTRELALDQFMQISQWKDGSPALLVVSGDMVEPEGLKKGSVTTTYTMYAPSGEELGSTTLSGEDASGLTVEAGHLLTKEEYKTDTYTPIGGGAPVEVRDRAFEQTPVGAGFGYRVASTWSVIDGSGSHLAVSDRLTGKELWNLENIDRPAALADAEDPDDLKAQLLPLTDDKGLLAWEQPGDDVSVDEILTVVDLKTGRLLAEGPNQDLDEQSRGQGDIVLAPDGGTVVTRFGGGAIAWNTETGAELWRQEDDERTIEPLGLTAAGVLYASVDGMGLTALELETKKVLASDLADPIPTLTGNAENLQFTTDGYAVLAGQDLFVFAPETKQ